MKPIYYLCGLLLTLTGCYENTVPVAPAPIAKCLPTIITQAVSAGGQLTNSVRFEMNYADSQVRSFSLTHGGVTQPFQTTYAAGHLLRVSDGTTVLRFTAGSGTGRAGSVVVSRDGAEQAVYLFTYEAGGRIARLGETRTVLPPDWYVPARQFTFTHNAAGDLLGEQVVNTLSDKTTVTQTTAYTVSATPAPLADLSEPVLLTVLSLYYRLDALPARFWQPTSPVRYETTGAGTGNATTLLTRAVFTPQLNASQRIDSQAIIVSTFRAGPQFPQDRTLLRTFSYACR